MIPLLNILICHIPERYDYMKRLCAILDPQLEKHKNNVVCLSDDSRYKKIGKKRNDLVARVDAKYFCFADDDDLVSPNYLDLLMEGIHKNVDCCSLVGEITWDGQNPKRFIHSLKYNQYFEKDNVYYRPPNHLNVVRTEIGCRFKFPEKNFGEDTDWAMQMCNSGMLKTEHEIDNTIYYYEYRSRK